MAAIPGLYNTGDGVSGGQQDTHYGLVTSEGTVTYGYQATDGAFPSAWGTQDATSQWLTPTSNPSAAVAVGDYHWSLLFDITDYEPATAEFDGRVKSDDNCIIYLNGVQIATHTGFPDWGVFGATSGFREGINELLFVVTNTAPTPTPSGLRVEFTASDITAKTTTPTRISGLYNTGSGYAQNTQDEHYLLSVVSGSTTLGVGQEHGYVTQDMVAPATGTPWVRNSGASRWLTPFDNQVQSLDPSVDGVYRWRQEFTVSEAYRDAVITGRIMADNAFELQINDLYVSSGAEAALPFDEWFEFEIRGALNVGTNYFDVLVTNYWQATSNPTGLRVELYYAVVEASTLRTPNALMFSCNT